MKAPLELHSNGRSTTGYWRQYEFDAEPHSVWLQQVDTTITCYSDGEPWLRYLDRYGEFFVLNAEGGLGELGGDPWLDLHAFDVLQDGWGRSGLRNWLEREPTQERRPASLLEVSKRFRIGRGDLYDVELPENAGVQGAFGYLDHDLLGPRETQLEFCLEPQVTQSLPEAHAVSGKGVLRATELWETVEHYRFSYAGLRGELLEPLTSYTCLVSERTPL